MPKINVPVELICPITRELMIDPVQASDGYTYERKAIEAWFKKNPASPMRIPLKNTVLIENFFARKIIDKFLKDNKICSLGVFLDTIKEGKAEAFNQLNFIDSYLSRELEEGLSAIHWAARLGHSELVNLLIDEGVSVNLADNGGDHTNNTALIWAACSGHTLTMEVLLLKNANINQGDKNNWTPLHWATNSEHIKSVKYLLEKNADLDLRNKSGQTPLHIAAIKGNEEIICALLDNRADCHILDQTERTPSQLIQVTKPSLARLIVDYHKNKEIARLEHQLDQKKMKIQSLEEKIEQLLLKIVPGESEKSSLKIKAESSNNCNSFFSPPVPASSSLTSGGKNNSVTAKIRRSHGRKADHRI